MKEAVETAMPAVLAPETVPALIEAVRSSIADRAALELVGGASKRSFGHRVRASRRLDLSAFSGILLYEPEELVMTAGPATPMAEIQAVLAGKRQQLAFEPPDFGPLWGGAAGQGSIGGAFACNLAGPRRFKAGAARDHLLGAHAVSGHGEAFKTGGRVVKNVTGYDLCKLLCGSFGTLAALTEITFKVLPVAERAKSLLILGLDDTAAGRLLVEAAQSPFDPSGLAHLPSGLGATSRIAEIAAAGAAASITAIRLEGPAPSVAARLDEVKGAFAKGTEILELEDGASAALWREIGDVHPFREEAGALWRLSVPPAAGPRVVARLQEAGVKGARWYFDWGGGLIWLALGPAPEASLVRRALGPDGGQATLLRAGDEAREAACVFQPLSPPAAALAGRVKESFDPHRLFNPGRLGPEPDEPAPDAETQGL